MTRYVPESFSLLSSFVLQVGVDLMEKCMQMIGGLQLVARTQSSQYVLNKMNWVKDNASLMLLLELYGNGLTLVSVDFPEQPNSNG